MALDKASLRQCAATLKEAGQAPLTDNDLKDLNEKLLETLRDELGMELATKKGLQELEDLAEQIVRQEKLADKDLAQLADEISPYGVFKFNLANSAEKAMQTLQEGRNGPGPGKEPQIEPEAVRKPLQAPEQSLQGLQA